MEPKINTPPWDMHSEERILDTKECESLPYVFKIRESAEKLDGVMMDSEVASYDDEFGYIFRYDTVNLIEDDGSFCPEKKGHIHKIESKLVLCTKDGQNIMIKTGSMYELPK